MSPSPRPNPFGLRPRARAAVAALLALAVVPGARAEAPPEPRPPLVVRSLDDSGAGTLRAMLAAAERREGPDTITFDPALLETPRTIELASALPAVASDVTLDGSVPGRLWRAVGVTVSGGDRVRVCEVAPGGRLTLRALTVARGAAVDGGGALNRGELRVEGVTFHDNAAACDGGAIAHLAGRLAVVNATFAGNRAGARGGGAAALADDAAFVHSTFAGNSAARGGGLYAAGSLRLANSVLADSPEGGDCAAEPGTALPPARNLIGSSAGCGDPIVAADARLGTLGYFNGPTPVVPLGGGSAAINLGDPADALDLDGLPLDWDQRGNGDPRRVAGFPDLGAFEHQAFPKLVVDPPEDTRLRACTSAARGDCPLRGALELALADARHATIRFDRVVFGAAATLVVAAPLPHLTRPLTLDAADTGGVPLAAGGDFPALAADPGAEPVLRGVTVAPPGAP